MEQKQIKLLINIKTDANSNSIEAAIQSNPRQFFQMLLVADNPIVVSHVEGKNKVVQFDRIVEFELDSPKSIWDMEVETGAKSSGIDYAEIIKDLVNNADLQTDWEVRFVEDMMDKVRKNFDMDRLSPKQTEWIIKLKEKYL